MKALRTILASVVLSVLMFSIGASAMHTEEVFSDVDSGNENYTAIKYLKDAEVVVGYSDGSYKPEAKINRAEFLKIVMEAYGHDTGGYSECFKDVTDEWYAPYICKAKDMGIVSGYADGYYRPDRDINFAEASKIVAEAFRLSADVNDPENWYHQYVVSLELLAAIPTSVDSFAKNITRGEMAEMVYRIKAEKTDKASNTYEGIVMKESGTDDTGDITSITLTGNDEGKVSWTDDGYSEKGYKVVWSKTEGPTYPTRSSDKYLYHSEPSTTSSTVYAFDGEGTYYVRVCEYLGGECGVYSNEIQLELSESEDKTTTEESDVNSITLTDDGDGAISWTVDGTSDLGFKVVWGMTSGPTYPTRSSDQYLYYSDSNKSSATVDAFDGDGTYYVRVCEYLGGACGTYSNEIEVDLTDDGSAGGGVTSLTLSKNGDGTVSWVVYGTADSGFKVVWSKTSGPEYPTRSGDQYLYYSDSSTTESDVLDAFDGDGTYYVRVCEYLGGECGIYSNEVEVDLTESSSSNVTSITLVDDGDKSVSWTADGTSDEGFKVVWSVNSGPEYPCRTGDQYLYYSDSSATESGVLDAFDGGGTYYVRVCEYLGGSCGTYSNEIEVEL